MTTAIFIGSFCTMSVMVLFKMFELRFNRQVFLTSFFKKGDVFIHSIFDALVFKYNRYKKISQLFFFEFLPSYTYELLVKLKDYVARKYYEANSSWRGKRILRSDGSVSFFLEKLAKEEEKETPKNPPTTEV
jgi:hypothetical protein